MAAPESLPYRVEQAERRIGRVEQRTENLNVLEAEVSNLQRELHDLGEKVDGLNKAILAAALSFVGGALIVALSLALTVGR